MCPCKQVSWGVGGWKPGYINKGRMYLEWDCCWTIELRNNCAVNELDSLAFNQEDPAQLVLSNDMKS